MENAKELLFWIWLAERLGPASKSARDLLARYEHPFDIYEADAGELERIEELSEKTREALSDKDLSGATRILESCERAGIGILPFNDERYPKNLRSIKYPPVLLYFKGTIPSFDDHLAIGMVGTRKMSAYGLRHAYKIAYELASAEAITVSGMAAGIDGVCAAASIAAGGKTVAVLGCGVDVVYPYHHAKLMKCIAEHGLLLSEYPPGTKPAGYHFPMRNRIISGIADGTIVIEAGLGSGSLITAKDAIAEGREVFALPSNIGSRTSEGTNGLLRDGATLVLRTEDILESYKFVYPETLRRSALLSVGEHAEVDLPYLERLGVIRLTDLESPAKAPDREVPRPPAKRASAKANKAEPENESLQKAAPDPALVAGLSPVEAEILSKLPAGKPVPIDVILDMGISHGDAIAAITTLEILGLVEKRPGSQYQKLI